jgi:Mrp family chromosome partitioning ATPase
MGCSTVALALAAAAGDRAIALVDADLYRPGLSRLLGPGPRPGWEEVVAGSIPYEEGRAILDLGRRVPLFPLREPPTEPDALFIQPGLRSWLQRLRHEYALVVLDGGPVAACGERWGPWVDVALVVAASGRTLADDWSRAWDRLEEGGTHVLGVVETFA